MNNLDLFEYAENANIMIEYGNLQKNKALALKLGHDKIIGIDKDVPADSAEERTLLAHELGHHETGALYFIDSPLAERKRMEHRALKWAILRTVPKSELVRLIREQYNQCEIAEYFGITCELISIAYTYYFEYGIAG